jgi:hypothetical protein
MRLAAGADHVDADAHRRISGAIAWHRGSLLPLSDHEFSILLPNPGDSLRLAKALMEEFPALPPGGLVFAYGLHMSIVADTGLPPDEELARGGALAAAAELGCIVASASFRSAAGDIGGVVFTPRQDSLFETKFVEAMGSNSMSDDDDATLVRAPKPNVSGAEVHWPGGEAADDEGDGIRSAAVAARQTVSAALEAASPYEAIAALDKTLSALPDDQAAVRAELSELRRQFTDPLWMNKRLRFHSGEHVLHILFGEEVAIGRGDGDDLEGVHIGCAAVSRFGKQATIRRVEDLFTITDEGSSNGTFLDHRFLRPHDEVVLQRLAQGTIVKMAGVKEPPEPGDCWLRIAAVPGSDDSLMMRIGIDHLEAEGLSDLLGIWPDLDEDLNQTWLFSPGSVTVGSGKGCGIVLRGDDMPLAAARITLTDRGYAVEPLADGVLIDGSPLLGTAPLSAGRALQIGRMSFRIEGH